MSEEMSVLEADQSFSVPKHLLWNLLQIIRVHGSEAELKPKLDRLEYNSFFGKMETRLKDYELFKLAYY
jgi:hypothetical protein